MYITYTSFHCLRCVPSIVSVPRFPTTEVTWGKNPLQRQGAFFLHMDHPWHWIMQWNVGKLSQFSHFLTMSLAQIHPHTRIYNNNNNNNHNNNNIITIVIIYHTKITSEITWHSQISTGMLQWLTARKPQSHRFAAILGFRGFATQRKVKDGQASVKQNDSTGLTSKLSVLYLYEKNPY